MLKAENVCQNTPANRRNKGRNRKRKREVEKKERKRKKKEKKRKEKKGECFDESNVLFLVLFCLGKCTWSIYRFQTHRIYESDVEKNGIKFFCFV